MGIGRRQTGRLSLTDELTQQLRKKKAWQDLWRENTNMHSCMCVRAHGALLHTCVHHAASEEARGRQVRDMGMAVYHLKEEDNQLFLAQQAAKVLLPNPPILYSCLQLSLTHCTLALWLFDP